MKRLVLLVLMVVVCSWNTLAFAGEGKMIGTISAIKMAGNGAEITLKDRKTDAMVVLLARDPSTMEKLKDSKIRVGDELRVRFDDRSKVIKKVQKTAGC
jgi:hypothetical protein